MMDAEDLLKVDVERCILNEFCTTRVRYGMIGLFP